MAQGHCQQPCLNTDATVDMSGAHCDERAVLICARTGSTDGLLADYDPPRLSSNRRPVFACLVRQFLGANHFATTNTNSKKLNATTGVFCLCACCAVGWAIAGHIKQQSNNRTTNASHTFGNKVVAVARIRWRTKNNRKNNKWKPRQHQNNKTRSGICS